MLKLALVALQRHLLKGRIFPRGASPSTQFFSSAFIQPSGAIGATLPILFLSALETREGNGYANISVFPKMAEVYHFFPPLRGHRLCSHFTSP